MHYQMHSQLQEIPTFIEIYLCLSLHFLKSNLLLLRINLTPSFLRNLRKCVRFSHSMDLVDRLPKEKIKWVRFFQKTYELIDKGLKTVSCCGNKMQVISLQLFDFLDRFTKREEPKILSYKQSLKCFEFAKACTVLTGYCSALSDSKWLSYFLNFDIRHSYEVLSKLWDVWQTCAEEFNYSSFEYKDSLAYAHCQDMMKIHTTLSPKVMSFPNQYRNRIIFKLEQIEEALNIMNQNMDFGMNPYILKHTEWTTIKENIGTGGYANVHLAKMKSTDQLIAVKEMKVTQLQGLKIKFMKREIDSLMKLDHPNVIKLIGVTVAPPFCIVTNYIPNGCLAELIHGKTISPRSTPIFRSRVMLDIARGMEYIHKMGLLHRDLKPPNVLLDDNDRAVICDFGLARHISPVMSCELGTMQWVAPELLTTGNQYNQSVDVYAFGVILWELMTSQNPFNGMRPIQIANVVLRYNQRPEIPETMPEKLKNLTKQCWAQDAKERPTFKQIREMIETGDYILPNTDKEEFLKYVDSTKEEHMQAMKKLDTKQSAAQVALEQLKERSPYDFNAYLKLEDVLQDKSLITDEIIDILTVMAGIDESSNLAKQGIDIILDNPKTNFDKVAISISKLFSKDPEYVILKTKQINAKIKDKTALVQSFLSPKTVQSPQLIDYIESISSKDIIQYVFDCLDEKFVPAMLKKFINQFGFCDEVIKSSFSTFTALQTMITKLKDKKKFNLLSETVTDSDEIKSILKILRHKKWHKREIEIMTLLNAFGDTMKTTYGGLAAIEIIKYAIKFEDTMRYVIDNDYWSLLSSMFLSQREEVINTTYDIIRKLTVPDEYSKSLFENVVLCYVRTKSDKIFKFIVHSINKHKGYDVTKFVSSCLSFLGQNQNKNLEYLKTILKINLSEHILNFTPEFSQNFEKALSTNDPNIHAVVGIIVLKNLHQNVSCKELVKPILEFLYTRKPSFAVASPFFEILLKSIEDEQVIKLLVQLNFVLYLHNIPLLYPRENYVPNLITQFAQAFGRFARM